MEYITSTWELDISRFIITLVLICILIYFIFLLIKTKLKKLKILICLIMISCLFLVVVNVVQILAPTLYFNQTRELTLDEVKEFTHQYAILENVGNIYKVKSKDIFK